ncbi:uncharacterized protein LOC131690044 [Topomyia yanbarensis]|uniref:uncharacterized protein LOC131690044 n=1 Tax=Topomyia yanbarensis TaxID=2498891 RepID=UPI00273CF3F3|nr:uncharacterized protein LOC131690044 [Topomyia yanbarensis]
MTRLGIIAAVSSCCLLACGAYAQIGIPNNYVCTEDFCESYRENTPCEALKLACKVQNSTHNGIILPSMTPCSCCETCIENLKLGEDCSVGGLGSPVPTGICGPGLYCMVVKGDEHPTCQPMHESSTCYKAQKQFDQKREDGTIGHLMQRPSCDADGNFQPVVCIPGQTCYCIDEDGNRIFGEAVHTASIQISMRCECSRLAAKAQRLLNSRYPIFTSRCDSKGSFDQLQCVDDICTCVDMHSGQPSTDRKNITRGLAGLPCFSKRLHDNTTYMRECELVKLSQLHDIREYETAGFNVLEFNSDVCQPDGWYNRIQMNDTHKYCANKDGSVIEPFIVERSSLSASQMNCKCARARKLLMENNSLEVPECCPNGNYKSLACRRGQCYCVDEDGNQTGVEKPAKQKKELDCFNDICELSP